VFGDLEEAEGQWDVEFPSGSGAAILLTFFKECNPGTGFQGWGDGSLMRNWPVGVGQEELGDQQNDRVLLCLQDPAIPDWYTIFVEKIDEVQRKARMRARLWRC